VILWRVFPFEPSAGRADPGGVLWFPRGLQGGGRHDNPERYGCIYLTLDPIAAIVEALAPFRGSGQLTDAMLIRADRRLALASLALPDGAVFVDFDDPAVLVAERLRPSQVATRERGVTQAQALRLYDERPDVAGLRWWSTFEAAWINVTLFDRAAEQLELEHLQTLAPDDVHTHLAATFLGLS
jgi:hypothetical protein